MTTSFQPSLDKVLIKRTEEKAVEQKTAGGLFIPETAQLQPLGGKVCKGTVVAVGPGKFEHGKFLENSYKPGMSVLFPEYAGMTVSLEGQDYMLLRADEVLGHFSTNSKE